MLDRMGRDCDELKKKKLFLLDMDGTIYEGDRLFSGTVPLLRAITAGGGSYLFLTNNSSRSVGAYVEKLRHMGVSAAPADFFTAGQATARELCTRYPGKTVYCMGTDSLKDELRSAGISLTERGDESAEVVLVGFDTQLTFEKLETVSRLLQTHPQLPYLATNPDFVCPTEYGFVPDCGAMCQLLEHAVHRLPRVIGKPEPAMVEQAMAMRQASREETLVIGDRLYTDIAAGMRAWVDTLCVLTGETDLKRLAEANERPGYVLDSVGDLARLLEE